MAMPLFRMLRLSAVNHTVQKRPPRLPSFRMSSKHNTARSEPPFQGVQLSQIKHPQQSECSLFAQTKLPSKIGVCWLPQQSDITWHQIDQLQQQTGVPQLPSTLLPQSNLSPQKDPPLIALPLEIKRHIFSYLEGPEPTHIILRRTNRHFRHIIPKRKHRQVLLYEDERDHLIAADQLAADDKQPKLFLPNHLACFTCLDVMTSDRFSDRNSYKARRVGGKDAHKRFCLNCGLRDYKYSLGQTFYINRVLHIVMRPNWSARGSFVAVNGNEAIEAIGSGADHRLAVSSLLRWCEALFHPSRYGKLLLWEAVRGLVVV